jgi:hypothetical protein
MRSSCSKEMLLDVPAYDFNWQTAYRLAEPKELPAGTRIHCVAHFDNSKDNLNNPNPNKEVRWGDQTWEEMMIGYFDIAVPRRESDEKPAASPFRERLGASLKAVGVIRKFDKNGDNQLTRDEVPRQYQATFNAWDVDKDDIVTLKEAAKALQR